MKRSMSRKFAVIAGALAILATSCSTFRGKADVDVQAVAVNLVFGARVPTPSPAPGFEIPEPTLPPIDVEPPAEEPPPPNRCEEDPYQEGCPGFQLCPPPNPLNSAPESPTQIYPGENEAVEGTYLFQHFGNLSGEPEYAVVTENTISDYSLSGSGYNYKFLNGVNGLMLRFEVLPSPPPDEEQDDTNTEEPGIYLRQIDIPAKDYGRVVDGEVVSTKYTFGPTNPIKLLNFPINAGDVVDDASPEFANKRVVGEDPNGAPIYQPSSNTLKSHIEVGTAEAVEVCSAYAQAWKATWTLEIKGDFAATMTGTFWFATSFGGWPVRDSYVITNAPEMIEGNFAENLMRVDPTGFI